MIGRNVVVVCCDEVGLIGVVAYSGFCNFTTDYGAEVISKRPSIYIYYRVHVHIGRRGRYSSLTEVHY